MQDNTQGVQGTQESVKKSGPEMELMRSLMRELFQSERSAQAHPLVEARRYPKTPPAVALEAVSRHATAVLDELPVRAKHHDLPVGGVGLAFGETFSRVRRYVVDLFMDIETSYRGTLLGMRHGLDVMRTLREAAAAASDQELAEWCDRIHAARAPLIEECANQLAWFAQHADQAVTQVASGVIMRGVQLLKSQLQKSPLGSSTQAGSQNA